MTQNFSIKRELTTTTENLKLRNHMFFHNYATNFQ